ncbi:MAG: CvpA family protein [Acetobacterales bacterium]
MDSLPINLFDLAVIAIVLVSGVLAFFRGLVHEVLAIAAWVGAVLIAMHAFPVARPFLRSLIEMKLVADLATGALLFIVSLLVLTAITRTLARLVKGSALNAVDRSLGFVFGLLRGAVLVALAWMFATWVVPAQNYPDWILTAKTLPLVRQGADQIQHIIPEQLVVRRTAAPARQENAPPSSGETFERLTSPPAQAPEGADREGYDRSERREMDRLIQGNQ